MTILRKELISISRRSVSTRKLVRFVPGRSYHADEHLNADDIIKAKSNGLKEQILAQSLKESVRNYGFTKNSVSASIKSYLNGGPVEFANKSTNLHVLFNNNEERELMQYYLNLSRISLQDAIKTEEFLKLDNEVDRLKFLFRKRLQYNIEHLSNDVENNRKLQENLRGLLASLVQPMCIPESIEHLSKLADDFLFYSGDESHSFDWYEKRMKIAQIFVMCELFMLNDHSRGFRRTLEFADEQLNLYQSKNNIVANIQEWLLFNGFSLINLIKSQLARG